MEKDTQLIGADLFNRYPVKERMVQIAYKEASGQSFKRDAIVSPEILAQLDNRWPRNSKEKIARKPRTSYAKSTDGAISQTVTFARNIAPTIAQDCAKESAQISQVVAPEIAPIIAPVEISQPAQTGTSEGEITRNWRDVLSDVICIGVVLFHAGLIAYDCSQMWGTPGTIGGVLAFMVQCLALLYSTDPNKTRTSETAILVVFLIDVLAWFVHYPTFMDNATVSASAIVTGVLCAVLCLFSFMASYLYRDSKII